MHCTRGLLPTGPDGISVHILKDTELVLLHHHLLLSLFHSAERAIMKVGNVQISC